MDYKNKIKELSLKHNKPIDNFLVRGSGIIEWVCEHGVGHPVYVPDEIKDWGWVHGCDNCCSKLNIRNKLKYLYINIEVSDGCNSHNHKVLHTTLANNISFAVNKYVGSFYGPGKRPNKDEWWYWWNELSGRLIKYKELSKEEYYKLNELFYE